jgi:hypothetical protein
MDDIYVFLVRGSSSKLPRGYLWLIPLWFAVLGLLILLAGREISGRMPVWLAATELGCMLLAGLTVVCVLSTVRRHAFRVSSNGIWLGCRTTRKRPRLRQVHIGWSEVSQIRMAATFYGTLLEVGLNPAARIGPRRASWRQFLLLLGVLIMPFGLGRGRPGLTAPRADPPRYLVRICDVTPADVREVLVAVKPAPVPVRVLTKPGPLRYRSASQPGTTAVPMSAAVPP